MIYRLTIGCAIALLLSACAASVPEETDTAPGSRVQLVEQPNGTYMLLRNGQPYVVKGAGTASGEALVGASLEVLAASGGNSIRTWGIQHLENPVDGKPLIDRAHELGLTVTAGFWVNHVRHGFDYSDPASIARQRAQLREAVLKYKDHPGLLLWLLGNEMEAFEPNVEADVIWRELNHLAGIIKELDPHHPVATAIAGATPEKIAGILEHYPNIDVLGINSYGNAPVVGQNLLGMGWKGPYLLTEFGVGGTWEGPTTPWNAPIEPDPSTKAAETYTAYTMNRDNNAGRSLGSYVFFWGHKQEATATWYGMFLPSGEKLPRVDAMAYAWSGAWPANRAPKLQSLETPIAFKKIAPGSSSYAEADILDREGDELRFVWDIRAESTDRRLGGDAESAPRSFPEAIEHGQGTARITFRAPQLPGGYRVFVTAYDGQGGAVVHNVPFYVEQ